MKQRCADMGLVAANALSAIPRTLSRRLLVAPLRGANSSRRQQATTATASQCVTDTWTGWPHELDHGLYWFGRGNRFHKHACPRADGSDFLDKAKPHTVVYTHGWELDRIRQRYRETFNYAANDAEHGVDVCTADAWLENGWNVGIFYWDQFADELSVFDCEAKIHVGDTRGMRYRTASNGFARSEHRGSVVDLFTEALVEALGDYPGDLRLAGHSLGSQVVLATARELVRRMDAGSVRASLLPSRVALLDPYFSLKLPVVNPQSYLPSAAGSTAALAVQTARLLSARGVALEHITTSLLAQLYGVCDPNQALIDVCASVQRTPEWIPPTDWQGRHVAAPNLYFHSFSSAPPRLLTPAADARITACPAAGSSDAEVMAAMGGGRLFVQRRGMSSLDATDDVFELVARR